MPIVTIAGETGSGGREVGRLVAELLRADYVDQELLVMAASKIGTSVEVLAKLDERTAGLRRRAAKFLQTFLEKSAAAGSAGDPFVGGTGIEFLMSRSYAEAAQPAVTSAQELDDKRFMEITSTVIRELAKGKRVVIIGRGGQCLLRDHPHALHVLLVAPLSDRVARVMEREKVNAPTAEKIVRETDKHRAAYIAKFFKAHVADPLLYHLTLNTSKMPLPRAAEIIATEACWLEDKLSSVSPS